MTTVIVVWLQYQPFAVAADKLEQLDTAAEVVSFFVSYRARPGHVRTNRVEFFVGEQPGMTWIRQNGEQRLLVDQLRAKTVHHADCAGAIRVEQRRVFANDRQVLIHEQALVNDVDLLPRHAEAIVFEFQFLWRADYRWIAGLFEELSKKLKLFDCRNSRQIDNRDTRR